jgi:hypothetical protein
MHAIKRMKLVEESRDCPEEKHLLAATVLLGMRGFARSASQPEF